MYLAAISLFPPRAFLPRPSHPPPLYRSIPSATASLSEQLSRPSFTSPYRLCIGSLIEKSVKGARRAQRKRERESNIDRDRAREKKEGDEERDGRKLEREGAVGLLLIARNYLWRPISWNWPDDPRLARGLQTPTRIFVPPRLG